MDTDTEYPDSANVPESKVVGRDLNKIPLLFAFSAKFSYVVIKKTCECPINLFRFSILCSNSGFKITNKFAKRIF